MSDFRTQNQTLLAKVEATPGVEETPTVADDAVKVANLQPSPNFDILDTDDEHTGSLDVGAPIVGGGNFSLGFDCTLRGSGAGGAAPEFGVLLRGCGLSETVTASDITGTAQAGGAATITLAAGASAVDDAYKGMVVEIDGGAGTGQSAVITGYAGAGKVATVAKAWATPPDGTSTYVIPANVLYRPASTGLENLTIHAYQHSAAAGGQSLLRKLIGAAGTMNLEINTRGIGRMSFNFTGILPALPDQVAHPGQPTFDDVRAEAFTNAESLMGGAAVKFNRFSLDLGAEISQADDPAATYGLDVAGLTKRKVTGSITPNLVNLATRNNMADFLGQTAQTVVQRWGSAAGRRVSLLVPAARLTGASPADNSGYAAEDVPFQAIGIDDGCWLCVH